MPTRACLVAAAIAAAGGPGCGSEAPDGSNQLFVRDMIEVSIQLDPADWDALRGQRKTRHQAYGMPGCRNQPVPNPYTWFSASVTIDGVTVPATGVRKKGQFGSQSTIRPSLKLKFDEFVGGQEAFGLDRLALNNSKADPTFARTCIAFQVFADAGIPAPRCTLAHVTVNGTDLGPFIAVEEMKRPFLRRHFANPDGNLYEGLSSDFRPDWVGGFEQETNSDLDASRADLHRLTDVLATASDAELIAALDPLVDLDEFFRFWAVEVVIWHKDGYAGNANNYYVYADPDRGGRFVFMPWDMDAALRTDQRTEVPDSVLAYGILANRLYAIPEGRARYDAALVAVLADVWRPAATRTAAARLEQLVVPRLDADHQLALSAEAQELVGAIDDRVPVIEAARAGGDPAWTDGLRVLPCMTPMGGIAGTFSTTWGTLDETPFATGIATLDLLLDSQAQVIERVGARSGPVTAAGTDRISIVADVATDRRLTITIPHPADAYYFESYLVAGTHPLLAPPVYAAMSEQDLTTVPPTLLRRFEVGEGTLTYDAIEPVDGAPVSGRFEATLYLAP